MSIKFTALLITSTISAINTGREEISKIKDFQYSTILTANLAGSTADNYPP